MSKSPTDGDSDWSCQVSFIEQEHTVLHTDGNQYQPSTTRGLNSVSSQTPKAKNLH